MCIACIRKLVKELCDLNAAVVASGGSPVCTIHVVQHHGHIHWRTTSADGSTSAWEASGGDTAMLRLLVADRWNIQEHASMPEADEKGLDEAVLLKLEECAPLLVPRPFAIDLAGED